MDYNEELYKIFDEWQIRSNEESHRVITRYGLLIKKDADVNCLCNVAR